MPTTNRPFFANFFAAFRNAHSQIPKPPPNSSSVLVTTNAQAYTTTISAPSLSPSSSLEPASASSSSLHPPTTIQPSSSLLSPPSTNPATIAAAQAAAATFRSSRPVHPLPSSVGTAPARARSASRNTPQQHHQQHHIHQHHHHHPGSPLPLALPLPMPMPLPSGSHAVSSPPLSSPSSIPPPTAYGAGSSPNGYCTPMSMSPPSPFATRSRTPSLTRATTRQRRGSDSSTEGWGGTGGALIPASTAAAEKWYIGGRTAGGEERFYNLGLVRKYRSTDRLSLDRVSL